MVDEIIAAGGEAIANTDSVAEYKSAEGIIEQAIATYGRLDGVINNAGILRDRVLVNMSEDDWDAVMHVHLKGHFVPTHHAANYWREKAKAGEKVQASIINTSSTSGLLGNVGQSNYGACKAAVAAMAIIVDGEMRRYGVTANAIAPLARTRLTVEATP